MIFLIMVKYMCVKKVILKTDCGIQPYSNFSDVFFTIFGAHRLDPFTVVSTIFDPRISRMQNNTPYLSRDLCHQADARIFWSL